MILQSYFLAIGYLIMGAGLLLVDYYSGKLLIFFRLRNALRENGKSQLFFGLGGVVAALLKLIFPVPPGPPLLGDLLPAILILVLVIYSLHLYVGTRRNRGRRQELNGRLEQELVEKTGQLIETNKRNFGFFVLICAFLHFLFPQLVLL